MRTEKEIKALETLKPKSCLGIRHLQTGLLFLAMVLAYGMRVNMSMAIVTMTDKDTDNAFDWSMQTQSVILSSFFWGYVILQVPAGEMATRFGGALLITISVGVNSVVSLVIPLAAHYSALSVATLKLLAIALFIYTPRVWNKRVCGVKGYGSDILASGMFAETFRSLVFLAERMFPEALLGGWQAVCACRVLQGLSQGFTYPSIHHLIGKWIPLEEKSSLGTIIYAGGQLGTALQLIASGFIADYWGWPAIFYVNGTLGAIWTALYVFLGADSPDKSRMISDQEQLYIETSLGHVGEKKKYKTPWLKIMTSKAFVTIILVHACQAWGFWTLMTEMPSYFKQVLGVDIKSNGVISALPYLAMFILTFPFGFISDYVLRKGYLSTTATRKLSNSIGMFGPGIALIGLSYSPAGNVIVAVSILTVVVGLNAGHLTGFMLVHIDMAPNFAGPLMGITNGVGNCVGIITPLAAGAMLKDETDASEWRKVFYVSSAIFIIGNILFLIFGTSKLQPWNKAGADNDNQNDTTAVEAKAEKVV